MKMCLPTVSAAGLQARISPHFGKAPFYTVVDVAAGTVESVPNPRTSSCGGRDIAESLLALGVDSVVCRRMGGHALERLSGAGVRVQVTDQWLTADAVEAARVGGLPQLEPGDACTTRP